MNCLKYDNMIVGNNVLEIKGVKGSILKIQSNWDSNTSIEFQVIGKMDKNTEYNPIVVVCDSTFESKTSINDKKMYSADITGYDFISIKILKSTNINNNTIVNYKIYG